MELRDYQHVAVSRVMAKIRQRPVLCLPTGAGKTVIARELLRRALEKNLRCLFLVHRKELVTQACERFEGLPFGIIKAGFDEDRAQPLQIASIQTLARRVLPPADLVIVDECHHAASPSWSDLLAAYPAAYLVGLTATPYRLDGKGLGKIFGEIVVGCTTRELCEQGVLVEPRCFSHPVPDLSHVRKVAGDYDLDNLALAMDRRELLGEIIAHWFKHANGRRTVVFAVNIAHSMHLRDAFIDAAVPAAHIDGTTHKDERAACLAALASGDVLVLSNCMILGEGWDLPALECAILARPTMSLSLHRQQIGRIMRCCDDKEGALVLDHAGNVLEHGLVTDEPTYSLADKVKREGATPLKKCPECYMIVPAACKTCPNCGFVFKAGVDIPEEHAGELVEYTKESTPRARYTKLVHQASARGRRLGWARFQYKEKFGTWPRFPDIELLYICLGHEWEYKNGIERCGRCYASKVQYGAASTAPH